MSQLNSHRVITALITPMTSTGALDEKSLDRMITLQEEAHNPILLLGSTGEGLALSLTEKKELLSHVFANKPRVPVIVGVGGFQLEEQLAWIEYCQSHHPLAGFLLVAPLYAKPGAQGQIAWFKALLDRAAVPCIFYNIPGRSAVKIPVSVIEALAAHPKFAGLKEASGDLEEFSAFERVMQGKLLYCGNDELLAAQVKRGAFGVISVASNVWPHETNSYLAVCLAGKNTPEEDALWEQASQALFQASNPIPLKVLCQHEGLIASSTVRPPLSTQDFTSEAAQTLITLGQKICKAFA